MANKNSGQQNGPWRWLPGLDDVIQM